MTSVIHWCSSKYMQYDSHFRKNVNLIIKLNYLYIYVLTHQPKGQLRSKHEKKEEIKHTKDKQRNLYHLDSNNN
jgi:hypothetical protein